MRNDTRIGSRDGQGVLRVIGAAAAKGEAPLSACGLTEREAEVLELVARGLSNREIAAELRIATGTVRKHLEHIYEKLGVRTRTAAAVLASTLGAWPVSAR